MKCNIHYSRLLIFLLFLAICYSFKDPVNSNQATVTGAWKLDGGTDEHVVIFADGYMTHAAFNRSNKTFTSSRGGTYKLENNNINFKWEYDTQEKEKVGMSEVYPFTVNNAGLGIVANGRDLTFTRVDDGAGALSGNWKISGRMQDGKINPVHTTGPRKTIKILSGKRFQWIAINPETKEFFGTGGGNYTFTNGKYTENIEFFSRDSSRVGKSLSFDDKLVNGEWHHSGASSTGDKIYEVWSKAK